MDGRDLGATFFALRPDLDAAQRVDGERKGLGFTKEIAAKPGVVEVKVVVADRATGRLGSVIVPVSAGR